MIKVSQLDALYPNASQEDIETYAPLLDKYMIEYKISTRYQIAAFLGNLGVESGEFKYVVELGDKKYFNKYEPGTQKGKDLGNTQKGDGYFFRGRGLIQITGRANFQEASNALFGSLILLREPQLLSEPEQAVRSACWFWVEKGINRVCTYPDSFQIVINNKVYKKFPYIVRLVNGGQNHLEERTAFFEKAMRLFS